MTQAELNRQIAQQTGESISEIMHHGFTILTVLSDEPDDADEERQQQQQQTNPVAV